MAMMMNTATASAINSPTNALVAKRIVLTPRPPVKRPGDCFLPHPARSSRVRRASLPSSAPTLRPRASCPSGHSYLCMYPHASPAAYAARERGRLAHLRTHHLAVQHVCLELHQQVIGHPCRHRCAACRARCLSRLPSPQPLPWSGKPSLPARRVRCVPCSHSESGPR